MSAVPAEKLDRLIERWNTIQDELNSGVAQAVYVKLTKEYADLTPVVEKIQEIGRASCRERVYSSV